MGLLGVAGLQSGSFISARDAQFEMLATVAAHSAIDRAVLRGTTHAADTLAVESAFSETLPDIDITVTDRPSPSTGVARWNVTVSWRGRDGEPVERTHWMSIPE